MTTENSRADALAVLQELSKWAAGFSTWQDEPKGPYLSNIIADARRIVSASTSSQPAAAPSTELTQAAFDDRAVDRFSEAMKAKLADARAKGRRGWQHCEPQDLSRMLHEHVEKGDPRDVANFCAFLWNMGEAITGPAPSSQPAGAPIPTDDLEQMTPNQRRALNKGLAALETMADLWAVETRLTDMSERIAAVADEAERAKRIAAMIHLGFVEGAYRHFLDHKDSQPAPSPADERAAKISDYLNAPGMWAQIYCCAVFVHGWPSDMARGAADEAVKEFGDAACKTVADLTHTLDEVLRVD